MNRRFFCGVIAFVFASLLLLAVLYDPCLEKFLENVLLTPFALLMVWLIFRNEPKTNSYNKQNW